MTSRLVVMVDDATKDAVRRMSADAGVSMSQFVRLCVAYYQDATEERAGCDS